jgi:hypothetical protein
VLWVPPGNGTLEAVVYEIEVVGVVKPPGSAKQAGKAEAEAAAPASPATPPH